MAFSSLYKLCCLIYAVRKFSPGLHSSLTAFCIAGHFQFHKIIVLASPARLGHTEETGNRNATEISENSYQPKLNTCY
jgi:hypothetical protein